MTAYRYWHKPIEWCEKCNRYRALDREGKCSGNHSIYARHANVRPVRYAVHRYGLSHPMTFTTHAQAANFLSEWHRRESWRTIARKLLSRRHGADNYHNGQVDKTAVMLSAYARRESESREVCDLLGMKPPKPHRRAGYFGRGESGRRRAERWDEISRKWGGATGLMRGILDGEYEVVEVNDV